MIRTDKREDTVKIVIGLKLEKSAHCTVGLYWAKKMVNNTLLYTKSRSVTLFKIVPKRI